MEGIDSPSEEQRSEQRPKSADLTDEHNESTDRPSEGNALGQRCDTAEASGVDSDIHNPHPDNTISNAESSMLDTSLMLTIEQSCGGQNKTAYSLDHAGETSDDSARSKQAKRANGRPTGESQSENVALENSDMYNKNTVSQHSETSHTRTVQSEPKCLKKIGKQEQHNAPDAVLSDDSSPCRPIHSAPRSAHMKLNVERNKIIELKKQLTELVERAEQRSVVPIPTGRMVVMDMIEPLSQDVVEAEDDIDPYVLHHPPVMVMGYNRQFVRNEQRMDDQPSRLIELDGITGPDEDDEPRIEAEDDIDPYVLHHPPVMVMGYNRQFVRNEQRMDDQPSRLIELDGITGPDEDDEPRSEVQPGTVIEIKEIIGTEADDEPRIQDQHNHFNGQG